MDDRELQLQRMKELATRARYRHVPSFTRFLEAPMEIPARTCANAADVRIRFFGGYEDAERRMAGFTTDEEDPLYFPISTVAIRWNPKYASPGHRDILGALMNLGIERDVLGDIAFSKEDGTAYLFVCEDMESYICASLESVGHTRVKAERYDGGILIREPEGVNLRTTVAQSRMDAILASACKLSRSEAQRLIETGLVRRNHIPELRSDIRLEANDLLSVRGYGRMRVLSIDDTPTRKGRIVVHIFRYT